MTAIKRVLSYFTKFELCLWLGSSALILLTFFISGDSEPLKLVASLIGATALILQAKGNPLAQIFMIIFAILYGIISYNCAYYGEMITYLGMSMPMAVFALISWLKNPFNGAKSEVRVNSVSRREYLFAAALTAVVTAVFYFVLKSLSTANLIVSTVSVTTSFIACYMTMRRCPSYALFYAMNDIVLIVLWISVALYDITYLSVIICFAVFLVNDLYGFISWLRMQKRQETFQKCN